MSSAGIIRDDAGQACVPNMIDGKPVILPSSRSFPVTSARQQATVHYAQSATVDIATQAVDSARTAFKKYRNTPAHERRQLLIRTAEIFEAKADEAARRQILETSCNQEWAQHIAVQTSTVCREIASSITAAVTGEIPPSHYGNTTLVFREPVGTVLLIPPWNAAVVLAARGICNALAAGCTVVLKASELCPWTHQLVAETFLEAGFPPGTVNMVMADRADASQITEALISHPAVRKIEFIGSAAVGRAIGGLAAKYMKPIMLELGDQSPAIVLEDADLSKAADLCAQGTLMHSGQVCFGTERIIVHTSVYEEFSRLLQKAMAEKSSMFSGVSVSRTIAEKGKATVDDAVRQGAKFLYGSSELIGPASLAPSILIDVNMDSTLSCSEAFAPTAFIELVKDDASAVEKANSRSGGLSASIFTQNYERAVRMSRELDFGQVNINIMTIHAEPCAPVNGFKNSGWGSNNGRYGIEEFLFKKSVSLAPIGT